VSGKPVVWHADARTVQKLATGTEALATLLPLPLAFNDTTLVTVGNKSYTAKDLPELLLNPVFPDAI